MVAFAAYFSFVNPIAEELFWRAFLRSELLSSGARGDYATLVVAFLYASYHLIITGSLMPLWFSIFLAFPFLFIFGLKLQWIANSRHTLLTAIGIHSGLDFAAAAWILDLRYGWLDSYLNAPVI